MKSIVQYITEKVTYRGGSKIAYFDPDKIGIHNGVSFGWGVYTFERKSETARYTTKGKYISHVEVPEDNGFNYIRYWDKLTTKQKNAVVKGVQKILPRADTKQLRKIVNAEDGMSFYNELKAFLGDRTHGRQTSTFLDSVGIEGMIKEHLGVVGDATYIVYNTTKVKIIESELVK